MRIIYINAYINSNYTYTYNILMFFLPIHNIKVVVDFKATDNYRITA